MIKSSLGSDVEARARSYRLSTEQTAFGFPTINPHYPHHDDDKLIVWRQAGIPGQYTGLQHSKWVENEKFLEREHYFLNAITSIVNKNKTKKMM